MKTLLPLTLAILAGAGCSAQPAVSTSANPPPAAAQHEPEPTFGRRPMSAWLRDLADGDGSVQNEAEAALIAIGRPAGPGCCKLAMSDNRSTRAYAMSVLLNIPPDPATMRPVVNYYLAEYQPNSPDHVRARKLAARLNELEK